MDKIEFKTDVATYGGDFNPFVSVAVYINGLDLREKKDILSRHRIVNISKYISLISL